MLRSVAVKGGSPIVLATDWRRMASTVRPWPVSCGATNVARAATAVCACTATTRSAGSSSSANHQRFDIQPTAELLEWLVPLAVPMRMRHDDQVHGRRQRRALLVSCHRRLASACVDEGQLASGYGLRTGSFVGASRSSFGARLYADSQRTKRGLAVHLDFAAQIRSRHTRHCMEADLPSWTVQATAATPQERSELTRVIWALAWPVILTFLLESLVGLIDMFMVGRLGATAVAAVGVGAQILSSVSVAMTAVGTGTLALVARHVGAREHRDAQRVLGQSIVAAFGLSVVAVVPVIVFARQAVGLFGVDAAVVDQGAGFVRLVMFSIPQSAVLFVIGSALRGAGDTRTPLFIGATVNVINVVGNYALIFGKFGLPALGVRGSALATTAAFSVATAGSLLWLARGRLVLGLSGSDLHPNMQTIRRILRIGYPTAGEQVLMQLGFLLYLVFAARYGTSAVAAYFIGVRILALSFLPGYGFAAAAAALVGQNLGAGDAALAERSGWESNRLAVYLMSAGGVFIFLTARLVATLFVNDASVVTDAVSFIRALAAAQPFMAMDFTIGGALRGAGDTRFPLVAVFVGFYGCRLGMAYLAAFVLHLSLPWVWSALIGDYVARAGLKTWRFRSGHWKRITV